MTPELKIVSVKIGDKIQKGAGWRGPCFYVETVCTDENGEIHEKIISTQRKKDLPAAIARYQKAVEDGNVFVQGEFIVTRMNVG